MNTSAELPADVIEALRNGRKIEAIKRLREFRNLGLKDAKRAVDAYEKERFAGNRPTGAGAGGLLVFMIVLLLAWAAWRLL